MTTVAVTRGMVRAVVLTMVLATVPFALPSPAAAQDGPPASGGSIVDYPQAHPLSDATIITVAGARVERGGCTFGIPDLALGAGQSAIEARQIETNFGNCTTKIEIGTPRVRDETPVGGASASELARPRPTARPSSDAASIAAVSSSGYYRLWWDDFIHIKVHEVKSNISWTWDGSCVTASSGSANYWWLTASGWAKNSSSSFIAKTCANSRVYTDASYKNGAFCWPGTVWSFYDNVTVQGQSNGTLAGWTDATWSTYPFACPNLHFHTELKRVTG